MKGNPEGRKKKAFPSSIERADRLHAFEIGYKQQTHQLQFRRSYVQSAQAQVF